LPLAAGKSLARDDKFAEGWAGCWSWFCPVSRDIVVEAMLRKRLLDNLRTAPRPDWLLKLLLLPLHQSTLSIEICAPPVGFFAQLNWCLQIAFFCEQHGLTPLLSAVSPQYRDPRRSPNWLTYFFDVEAIRKPDFVIRDLRQLQLGNGGEIPTIERGAALRGKYLPVKAEITQKVESFVAANMAGRHVLGVHFRGTDKTIEAPRVDREVVQQTIREFLEKNPNIDCLFVASDEASFIPYVRDAFPALPVVSHDDVFRSSTTQNFYQQDLGEGNYIKGEEALINCLLLSRCSTLIRTTSFLSAWASIFNPELPIVLLNEPYAKSLWYPEKRLIPRSLPGYGPAK
jgi:hypothetical protein